MSNVSTTTNGVVVRNTLRQYGLVEDENCRVVYDNCDNFIRLKVYILRDLWIRDNRLKFGLMRTLRGFKKHGVSSFCFEGYGVPLNDHLTKELLISYPREN